MIPEYVTLNEETRRVVHRHPQIGTSSGNWWCPFCDNSQAEGQTACGKCGAITIPVPPVAEIVHPKGGDQETFRHAEVAGVMPSTRAVPESIVSPAAPGGAAEPGSVPVRRTRATRTPPPSHPQEESTAAGVTPPSPAAAPLSRQRSSKARAKGRKR